MTKSFAQTVSVRKFPSTFRAMLAISTDIDHTTISNFRETHRFLNTKEPTSMGEGLGLDIANSMWIYKKSPKNTSKPQINSQISYFSGTNFDAVSPFADEIMEYARSGWIDTLHSYGDFSQVPGPEGGFTRELAEKAIEVLQQERVNLPVWVNHGNENNTQNIGVIPTMAGDVVNSQSYHADMMLDYGVRFLGTDHVPDFGNDNPLTPLTLKDNSKIWGFQRFARFSNLPQSEYLGTRYGIPYARKKNIDILWAWHPRALHLQITPALLNEAEANGRFVILAQHLGSGGPMNRFGEVAVDALRLLAERQERGSIVVTRTSRLLEYERMRSHVRFETNITDDKLLINITTIADPILGSQVPELNSLRGLSFDVPNVKDLRFAIAGKLIDEGLTFREPLADGKAVAGITWHERDLMDHTKPFRSSSSSLMITAKLDSQLADEENLATRLSEFYPSELAASYSQGLNTTIKQMVDIGFAGRSRLNALIIGTKKGFEPSALAMLNRGKSKIACIEPDMASRNEASSLGTALGLSSTISFSDDNAPLTGPSSTSYNAAWIGEVAQFEQPEFLMKSLAERLRPKDHVYINYPGVGLHLKRASEAGAQLDLETADDIIGGLYKSMLSETGLGSKNRHELCVLSRGALFEMLRIIGFRFVESPGFLQEVGEWAGEEAAFDAVIERNANDKKKYFVKDAATAFLEDPKKDALWIEKVQRLIRIGLQDLATRILNEATGIPKSLRPQLASTRVMAAVKSGRQPEAVDVKALSRTDHRVKAMAFIAVDAAEAAIAELGTLKRNDAETSFLLGAAYLAAKKLKKAEAIFDEAYRSRDCIKCFVGLYMTLRASLQEDKATALLTQLEKREKVAIQPPIVALTSSANEKSFAQAPAQEHPHVISVVGISFCGSSVFNLVMGSHEKIHGGGELHKLFMPQKHPRCSVCQYDCNYWTETALAEVRREGVYRQLANQFSTNVIVDSSKTINHFEATHPLNGYAIFDYLMLIKHPIRHAASYVNNKYVVNQGIVESMSDAQSLTTNDEEILNYANARFTRLLKDYKSITERIRLLAPESMLSTVRYEEFVQYPQETLTPILKRAGLEYDPGMLSYTDKEHHPIGGNRGPHYQINKKLSTTRFVGYRKDYYDKNDGLALDDKFVNTFSSDQLKAIEDMESYQILCDYLGYGRSIDNEISRTESSDKKSFSSTGESRSMMERAEPEVSKWLNRIFRVAKN